MLVGTVWVHWPVKMACPSSSRGNYSRGNPRSVSAGLDDYEDYGVVFPPEGIVLE